MTESFDTRPVSVPAIGVVESMTGSVMAHPDYDNLSRIRIFPQFLPGLEGMGKFSHFFVIYHQNRAEQWMRARNWPEGALAIPPPDPRAGQGIFTVRAPCRPARLGSCVVKLVCVDGDVLTVRGLDALDGTPVLDLKIYLPQFDSVPDAVIPEGWKPGMQRHYQPANK